MSKSGEIQASQARYKRVRSEIRLHCMVHSIQEGEGTVEASIARAESSRGQGSAREGGKVSKALENVPSHSEGGPDRITTLGGR